MHCKFRKNNTFLTLTKVDVDMNHEHNHPNESFNEKVLYYLTLPQKVVLSQSTGFIGFRKAQRGEYEASFQLTSHIFKIIRERGLLDEGHNLEIVVSEFGKGRKAFFDALKGKEGVGIKENVTKLSDLTAVKFGGVRSPARRRI
ncbi:DEKNAAC102631 [Brettanomyces naardenensis]|uniref:Small ribosomal subunit protein uS11m n=1 Tax=Brettanomyces naardenensis TaxID=13370 RepID=A0A448YK93_BRENA|nr:DEKNAAC102631 [Brettanomyces naardenensis]